MDGLTSDPNPIENFWHIEKKRAIKGKYFTNYDKLLDLIQTSWYNAQDIVDYMLTRCLSVKTTPEALQNINHSRRRLELKLLQMYYK